MVSSSSKYGSGRKRPFLYHSRCWRASFGKRSGNPSGKIIVRPGHFIHKKKTEPEACVSFYNIYGLFSTKTEDFSLVLFDERRKKYHSCGSTQPFPGFCAKKTGRKDGADSAANSQKDENVTF